ncbi:MAG: SRPBCC domain-containing protein [Arenibacter sp.]|nr:SRPBCC domain-containing protein [Arenibacter sp.]
MTTAGFDSFTKKIHIKSDIKKLYWCWATSQGISKWFLKKASYLTIAGDTRPPIEQLAKGDSYIWEWHNWDGKEEGKILAANGEDFLEFTFANNCSVSISMEPQAGYVLLTLKQYNIPTDDKNKLNIYFGCSNGWTFWLTNLKAYLEYGITLNETDIDLRNLPNAEFEFVNI